MPESIFSRIKRGWNAFMNRDPTPKEPPESDETNLIPFYSGGGYSYRPDRIRFTRGSERTIVSAIYNKIAIDCSAVSIKHVQLDDNDRFLMEIDSGLNSCLNLEANIDQTGRAFIQDIVLSLFDEGVVAIVPVDTDKDPNLTDSYDIHTMRTGKILEWYPRHVKVRVYNDRTGNKEDVLLHKSRVGIVENPFYAVVNEPNSVMQRLIRKLSLLDVIDDQSGSGKLDLIIQLPYTVKSEMQREQAEKRRKAIEDQLYNSKYGIAYMDSTEKITQLNRSVENNLMSQIQFLTSMLYSQLGITESILNDTADEQTLLNYNSNTIEPIVSAIVDEIKRKFLTKNARTRGQSIMAFKDPFKLVPVNNIAEVADKFTRNAILTSNELRQIIGFKPSDDPDADVLRNKNLNQSTDEMALRNQIQNEETYNEEVPYYPDIGGE